MQKIKDKSNKIKVNQLQTNFEIYSVKLILMITYHNVLNLLSCDFCLLSFFMSLTDKDMIDNASKTGCTPDCKCKIMNLFNKSIFAAGIFSGIEPHPVQ